MRKVQDNSINAYQRTESYTFYCTKFSTILSEIFVQCFLINVFDLQSMVITFYIVYRIKYLQVKKTYIPTYVFLKHIPTVLKILKCRYLLCFVFSILYINGLKVNILI